MRNSVFLSYPKPCFEKQKEFIQLLRKYLEGRGLAPRTLGVTDYDMEAPLTAIRRIMIESNGLITVAFGRTFVKEGVTRFRTDLEGLQETTIEKQWLTTPWAHIEPAMAYQLGLPILILREQGVRAEGILEQGVTGLYLPEFDLSEPATTYFETNEWKEIVGKWEGYVRAVVDSKGHPPELY